MTPSGLQAGRRGQPLRCDDRAGLRGAALVSAMARTDWIDRALAAAALTGTALVAERAGAVAGRFLDPVDDRHGDTQRRRADLLGPAVDRRQCPSMAGGAVGDGTHDDTAAIQAAIDAGIANNWPVHLSAGTYKVDVDADDRLRRPGESRLPADFRGRDDRRPHRRRRSGVAGAVLRRRAGSPADCFYFKEEGTLFVLADTPDYAVVIGNDDFSDAHNSIKLDHLNVNNEYRFRGRRLPVQLRARQRFLGGLRFGRRRCRAGSRADAFLADFRRRHGAGHRRARARARKWLQLRQYVFRSRSGSVADLSQHHDHPRRTEYVRVAVFRLHDRGRCDGQHAQCADQPDFRRECRQSRTAIGRHRDRSVIGNWAQWQFPAAASYTAGRSTTGPSCRPSTRPDLCWPSACRHRTRSRPAGRWGLPATTARALTVDAASGSILGGGKALPSLTLGPGNYEYAELVSDGSHYRAVAARPATR